MTIQQISLEITGISPLVMHSGRLVDPAYWATKELKKLTSKRSKTEADVAEVARIEFLGSLYLDDQQRVILPDVVLEAALVGGAKKLKLGQQTKAAVFVSEHAVLDYGAQLSPEDLWNEERFRLYVPAKVGTSKIMRMRPIFRSWKATIGVQFLDDMLSDADIVRIAEHAGTQAGVGDWRPKHGRFTAKQV